MERLEDEDALLLLREVYTAPADASGPLSPPRLALCCASLAALDPAEARGLVAANAGLLEGSTRGSLQAVHEHLLELRADELLPAFAAGALQTACARGHLHIAEYLLRRGLVLDALGEQGEAMLEGLCFTILVRALGAAAAQRQAEEEGGEEEAGASAAEVAAPSRGGLIAAASAARRAAAAAAALPSTAVAAPAATAPALVHSSPTRKGAGGSGSSGSPPRELPCLALLMAARADLDAQMGLLAGLLLPAAALTDAEASAAASTPPLLPASPAASLLWCLARLRCPHSPLRQLDGVTPLHLAAAAGLLPEALALLAGGADANAIASDGTTPLGAVRASLRQEEEEGEEEEGGAAPALSLRLQAIQSALVEAGGRQDWRDALSARGGAEGASGRRHPPPGLSAVMEWGRRGMELHAAAELAASAEAVQAARRRTAAAAGATPVGAGAAAASAGGGGAPAAAARHAYEPVDDEGRVEAGFDEVYVGGEVDHRKSLNPMDGSLVEVNAGMGGGGIFVESGRKGNKRSGALWSGGMPVPSVGSGGAALKPSAEAALPSSGGGGGAASVAGGAAMPERRDGVKAGMVRSSGAFGAKFLS